MTCTPSGTRLALHHLLYPIATEDRMIPPDAQRAMSKRAGCTMVEVHGSHAVYVSQPQAVARLIEQVAKSLGRAPR